MKQLALIALLAVAGPALATELGTGTMLGKTVEEVQASLTGMGYELRKTEMEDGKIEAYVVKDGKKGEVYVDTATGLVSKLEMK